MISPIGFPEELCNALTVCLAGAGDGWAVLRGKTATDPPPRPAATHHTSSGSETCNTALQQCWARSGAKEAGVMIPSPLNQITLSPRPQAPHSSLQPPDAGSALSAVAVALPSEENYTIEIGSTNGFMYHLMSIRT